MRMKKYVVLLGMIIFMQFSICLGNLTKDQKRAIGMRVWKNEAGQKYDLLVFWNPKESFPSLGIAHFIWYPAGKTDIYTQTFPDLLDYFTQKGIILPAWLA